MTARLAHTFFLDRERRAVYESTEEGVSLLLWRNGRKVRLPVSDVPATAESLLCPASRIWEWATEEWGRAEAAFMV